MEKGISPMPEETFFFDHVKTPLGELTLVADEKGALRFTWFEKKKARGDWRSAIERYYPKVPLTRRKDPFGLCGAVKSYFEGDVDGLDRLPVVFSGTPFQKKVWQALRRIPAGTTTSYGALAKSIGEPKAMRAVGLANGANPIGVVVPCHRVIGADGSLTGYGGGLDRKRWLLAHEARHTATRFKLEATT
jgi:methylated-DNA-[protein]-cysteine S-methyltransferase